MIKKILFTSLSLIIITSFMICLIGCTSAVSPTTTATEDATSSISEKVLTPIKIAIFLDDTGSVKSSRIEPLSPEDFQILIDLLHCTGGEMAFGFIRDESNRPLLRLHMDSPPIAPRKPSHEGNPFEVAERTNEYQIKLKTYLEQMELWKSEMEKRTAIFLNELKNLLANRAYAKRTDMWGAVAKAELFLCEDELIWNRVPKKYAIFITDGLDNIRKREVPIKSGAKVILVNGIASSGVFNKTEHIHFESVKACFSFVSADGRRD